MSFDERRIVPGGQWYELLINFEHDILQDAVMETTEEAALEKARCNWPDADEIILIEDLPEALQRFYGVL